ncbi:DUF1328 domain-containing protein [Halorubrum depositum]|uniref:DUF1328 domain-containing protein n=1 Tax=Halorubrum depositum TaxID=2583992 RepID=UPI0011A037B6|nr:DUF1328 domain-containing protein [Halorubrum depositum]
MDGTTLMRSVGHRASSGIDVSPLQFSGDFLELAVVFFVIAIVAAIFGARGVAGVSMAAAKWLVIVFLVLAIISVLL